METRQSARAGLEVAAHRFTHARSVSCHVFAGPAAGTIVAHAHAARSTLIVMGTHGHSGLARVLLGSVANAVIRSADVPVLAIRPDLAVPPAVPTRVLLPLDGTERSAEIVRRSLPLASSLHWTAVLYWVAESPEQTSLIPTGVLAVSKTLGQKGIQTEIRTGSGDPARDLRIRNRKPLPADRDEHPGREPIRRPCPRNHGTRRVRHPRAGSGSSVSTVSGALGGSPQRGG